MLCEGYIGVLSDKMRNDWYCKVNHPLDIFSEYEIMSSAYALLDSGDKYFHDKRQIDWGSWAWKGSNTEVQKMMRDMHINTGDTIDLQDGIEYGILFIDSGFSGEELYGG